MAALLTTTEVMVAEKTEKPASPMLNGGMAEAGFSLNPKKGRAARL